MSLEGQLLDQKSLRAVTGKTTDWDEIAKDCVAFANSTGGRLLLGIENAQSMPPADQCIPSELPDTLRRKLAERTVNVTVLPDIATATNGGEYIELRIPRSTAVASTTDGRYFLRVADQSKPVTGDDVMRLASERFALPWETQTTLHVSRHEIDADKRDKLLAALRASDRIKPSVKEKSDDELLNHYQLAQGRTLTNLGVLCLGRQRHRAQLTTAPVIQFIKYDEHGHRILKPEIIEFIAKAEQTYQLTQRERIALGLLAQNDALTARELADALELPDVEALQPWLHRLLDWQLVQSAGRTRATRYFVNPSLLRSLQFTRETTLKRIEPHRLAALVLEDLQRYPRSAISDIHRRVGGEIHPKQVKRALEELIERELVRFEGNKRWRRYWAGT